MKTFEITTRTSSQEVNAETLVEACQKFLGSCGSTPTEIIEVIETDWKDETTIETSEEDKLTALKDSPVFVRCERLSESFGAEMIKLFPLSYLNSMSDKDRDRIESLTAYRGWKMAQKFINQRETAAKDILEKLTIKELKS